MRDVVSSVVPVVAFAIAGAALGCGSDPPQVPANPTYTADVAPILNLHCIRCHGAGDMLNIMNVNGYPNSRRSWFV